MFSPHQPLPPLCASFLPHHSAPGLSRLFPAASPCPRSENLFLPPAYPFPGRAEEQKTPSRPSSLPPLPPSGRPKEHAPYGAVNNGMIRKKSSCIRQAA